MKKMTKISLALLTAFTLSVTMFGCGFSDGVKDGAAAAKGESNKKDDSASASDGSAEKESADNTEKESETANVDETPVADETTVAEESPIAEESPVSEEPQTDKDNSGNTVLPCGIEITLFDASVRNDVTGNWRLARIANSSPISDYAMEYYENMFSSDEEIHAIVNFTLNTTTCIKVMSGTLFSDTYEYVDGEEHDANLLFTGNLLDSKIINIETGEEMQ